MRRSGQILAQVLEVLKDSLKPGMSTKDLARIAKKELSELGGQPAFLGYQGFPEVLCVSTNDEVVHGIPDPNKIIKDGDIVSMDFGVIYGGMITDAAISVIAGNPRPKDATLVEATKRSLQAGIDKVRDGVRVGDIASTVEGVLKKGRYGIVEDLVGHGVGHELHEEPNIPNYGIKGGGDVLKAGMTIAIEPMATLGSYQVYVDQDRWTVKTRDGSRAAHFEHTVLITDKGCEVLTELKKTDTKF